MTWLFMASFLWMAASLVMPRGAAREDRALQGDASPNLLQLALLGGSLVALMVLGQLVNSHSAMMHPENDLKAVPIVVLRDDSTGNGLTTNAQMVISILETACLFGLYRALRGRKASRGAVVVVCLSSALMALAALFTNVSNSSDIYGYVGYGLRPATAYAPEAVRFTGEQTAINAMFGFPLQAAPYGPLWLATAHIIVTPFAGLAAQLRAIRLFELCSLLAIVAMLARLRTPLSALALLVINPSIDNLWIADGHNDIFSIALIFGAVVCTRFPAVRFALVVVAGLVKLPLVIIGTLAFAGERSLLRRILFPIGAVVACVGLSYAIGGKPYFGNLLALGSAPLVGIAPVLRGLDILLIAGALAAAILARRYTAGATWLWPSLAAYPTPWYAIWGLPYAAASGSLALFLIAEPVVSFYYTWNYPFTPASLLFSLALAFGPLVYALIAQLRARNPKPAHPQPA